MKKIINVLVLILILFSLTSCTHIKDINGPNGYFLEKITDDDIVNPDSNYTSLYEFKFNSKKNYDIVGIYRSKKLSGVVEVNEFYGDYFHYSINFECKKGNAMLFFVQNGVIVKKILANTKGEFSSTSFKDFESGTVKIIIAGESAEVFFEYKIYS